MNVTDWNAIADAYFEMDDPEGRAVLTFIRDKLTTLRPKRLLDYGGGDGKFAVLCAESLPLQEIVTYDPAPRSQLSRGLSVRISSKSALLRRYRKFSPEDLMS